MDYAEKNELKYRTDESNFDIIFKRNLLRLEILPELEKINPSLRKTLLTNIKNYRQVADFLEIEAEKFAKKEKIKLKENGNQGIRL